MQLSPFCRKKWSVMVEHNCWQRGVKTGCLHWHKLLRMPTKLEVTGESPQQLYREPFSWEGLRDQVNGSWTHMQWEKGRISSISLFQRSLSGVCWSADLDRLASAAVIQREEANPAKALSQAEQRNYCFPGVVGTADTTREEAELWIPALCPVLGKARRGRAVETLEGLQLTSTSRSQL